MVNAGHCPHDDDPLKVSLQAKTVAKSCAKNQVLDQLVLTRVLAGERGGAGVDGAPASSAEAGGCCLRSCLSPRTSVLARGFEKQRHSPWSPILISCLGANMLKNGSGWLGLQLLLWNGAHVSANIVS